MTTDNIPFTIHLEDIDERYHNHSYINRLLDMMDVVDVVDVVDMVDVVSILNPIFTDIDAIEIVLQDSIDDVPELQKTNIKIDVSSKKYNTIDTDEIMCCICSDKFEILSLVSVLPMCKHIFHTDCIIEWGFYKQSCPVCRTEINISN